MAFQSLAEQVTPQRYDLLVRLSHEDSFTGHGNLDLVLKEPQQEILLHADDLSITAAEARLASGSLPADIRPHPAHQTIALSFQNPLQGQVRLSFDYTGKYQEGHGLYRAPYRDRDGTERFLHTTHLEPSDGSPANARRLFPCIDEPGAKAHFTLTVETPDASLETVLSNTPPVDTEMLAGGGKRVRFGSTPLMSPYLVYIGAGQFESTERMVGNVPVRVLTTPGKIANAAFALDIGSRVMEYFQEYFGLPYALEKLDNIALPRLLPDGMENWGAITYREENLLYDPQRHSIEQQRKVAKIVAHEIAHQWFGDLVTMAGWQDLWLKEGFAEYMALKALEVCAPELGAWSYFLTYDLPRAMRQDTLATRRAIRRSDASEGEKSYDAMTYTKAAMILRMIDSYRGEESFQQGVRSYLRNHQYGSTQASDLWDAMGPGVGIFAEAWITKPGIPCVSVQRVSDRGIYEWKLSQKPLDLSQKSLDYTGRVRAASAATEHWPLPLTLVDSRGKRTDHWMPDVFSRVAFEAEGYVLVNPGRTAYCRVKYAPGERSKLGKGILNHEIAPVDRWSIHNDLAEMCYTGDITLPQYLKFLRNYRNEDSGMVAREIIGNLDTIERLCYGESFFSEVQTEVQTARRLIATPIFRRMGWEERKGEPADEHSLRIAALYALAKADDLGVVSRIKSMAAGSFDDLPRNLRDTVSRLGAWHGDQEWYDRLTKRYHTTTDAVEQLRIAVALGHFRQEELLQQSLGFALRDDVIPRHSTYMLAYLTANPSGKRLVWPWLRDGWEQVTRKYSGDNAQELHLFVPHLKYLGDEAIAVEMADFFRDKNIPLMTETLEELAQEMAVNARFLENARKSFAR